MVADHERGPGQGAAGKLTSDPAVETAAVALLHGFDPLQFLGYAPEDYDVAIAVLERAQKIRADELKWFADYVSGRTAGLTSQAITKWIARAFRS
ncbi:hypothetical protein GCM10028801_41270 [Nocardioides maradonensis]